VSAGDGHAPSDLERLSRERPGDFTVQLAFGRSLIADGRFDEAVEPLQRAKRLFPQYAGHGSAYEMLARVHLERGALEDAAVELRALTSLNGGHYQGLLDLADLEERLGNTAAALAALDRAMYVYPLDLEPHRRLAELAEAAGRWDLAVRERRAVLALRPVDRADALYRLARALHGAGQRDAARSAVLRSLEIAPSFGAAQDLLLELHDARNR
jgi:tetratricopeptide (TPR) repeat protein